MAFSFSRTIRGGNGAYANNNSKWTPFTNGKHA